MKAPHNDALRSLWPLDTDECWAARDAASKAIVTLHELGERLEGISDLLYAMAFNHMASGGYRNRSHAFLAATVKELAMQCARAYALLWAESQAEDERAVQAELAESREARKAAGAATVPEAKRSRGRKRDEGGAL